MRFVNVLTLACAWTLISAAPVQKVINGDAAPAFVNWQVALITTTSSSQTLCGGSILSPTMILTAGHCVRDLSGHSMSNPQNMQVTPGQSRSQSSLSRGVVRYWVEPTYTQSNSQSQRVDLAIVQVSTPFALSSQVQPIAMCTANCFTPDGTSVLLTGYGETVSDVSSSTSTTLRAATLYTVSDAQCSAKFSSSFGCTNCLPTTNICAGSNSGQDSCFGDSGGPLVRDFGAQGYQLIGVVSSGTVPASQTPSCGVAGEYGLYVSVPENQAWIQRVLSGQDNASAITSACVAAGTCASTASTPTSSGLSYSAWYYIIAAVVGGLILLLMLVACMLRHWRRRRLTHVGGGSGRIEPVRHIYAPSAPPSQHNVPVYKPPQPMPSAPPPPYGAPVYQTTTPQQYAPAPAPVYYPQPQMYGAPPPQPPPLYGAPQPPAQQYSSPAPPQHYYG